MTPEEKKRVVEALTRAKTADEVRRLERMLAEGVVPEDVSQEAEEAGVVVEKAGEAAEAAEAEVLGNDEGMVVDGQEPVEEANGDGEANGNGAEVDANGA
jgi:hypothetical protein